MDALVSRSQSQLLRKLRQIMRDKKTNLCVAADLSSIDEIVNLVNQIGEHICILKIHSDYIIRNSFLEESLKTLYALKKKFNFLLFEDRKFSDSDSFIQKVYELNFVKYVDLVTVKDADDATFRAIENGVANCLLPEDEFRGCLAVCDMSFSNLVPNDPEKLLQIADKNTPICCGIIAQKLKPKDRCAMIKASPGIHLSKKKDGLSQNWRTPEEAIADGADIIIVGRGITLASEQDRTSIAIEYKERAFRAYQERLESESC